MVPSDFDCKDDKARNFGFSKNGFYFQNINPPIGSFGKLCQIYAIVSTKNGDNVSKLPFISNSMTSSARLITVMIETQDMNLCVGYGVSVILNLMVAITAYIYSGSTKKSD